MLTDDELRHYVYTNTAESGRPPRSGDVSAKLGVSKAEVLAGFARIREKRLLCLDAEGGEIVMAPPFSAAPTTFLVTAGERQYFANCVWDAYGIPAALRRDASIEASCGCCSAPMSLGVKNGSPVATEGVAHFAVPASHWWDDLPYT